MIKLMSLALTSTFLMTASAAMAQPVRTGPNAFAVQTPSVQMQTPRQGPGAMIALPVNPTADTHYCCDANGCYPAPDNHPWNCGPAPIVVWCPEVNGIPVCQPQ